MVVIDLVRQLLAGEADLFGIDHNHKITGIHVGREYGLVLAAQPVGNLACQPAQNLVLGIHEIPVADDLFLLCMSRLHHFTK